MIKVENLTFQYLPGETALKNVNIDMTQGGIFAILGESGSGKTTFLNCLSRFLKPTKGQILCDEKNILDIPETQFRQIIGVVFQKLYLFPHLTVLQNMTLAPVKVLKKSKTESQTEAMEILVKLGIESLAQSYPAQISGGQAQRAAIARGLLLHPQYMLLDEPTSALDANTTDDFAHWLIELSETEKNSTNFIIVSHDTIFAEQVATQGVYLSQGRVRDTGEIGKIISHVKSGKLVEA